MAKIYLNQIAHGRSGDKGDTSNVCVYARDPKDYEIIKEQVTPEKVKAYFGDMVKGEVTRYEVPSLNGFNFVMKHALGGGATFSAVPTLVSIGIAFGVSVGIGVLFGYLPANKAARLNPIDALRYD